MASIETVPDIATLTINMEEVKFASETLEIQDFIAPVETKSMKRNSLSKFFTFKGFKTAEGVMYSEQKAQKTSNLMRLFSKKDVEVGAPEGEAKVPKTSTLTRLFNKKNVTDPEMAIGSEASPRRSVFMRGLMNCHVPWIGRKPSQMNLQSPISVHIPDGDEEAPQETAKSSEIF